MNDFSGYLDIEIFEKEPGFTNLFLGPGENVLQDSKFLQNSNFLKIFISL